MAFLLPLSIRGKKYFHVFVLFTLRVKPIPHAGREGYQSLTRSVKSTLFIVTQCEIASGFYSYIRDN
jgi:hypothetical protein